MTPPLPSDEEVEAFWKAYCASPTTRSIDGWKTKVADGLTAANAARSAVSPSIERSAEARELSLRAGLDEIAGHIHAIDRIIKRGALPGSTSIEEARREGLSDGWKFNRLERVRKIKGSQWQGFVVGFYSTDLTPRGYAVESEVHSGSVQIYPEAALEALAKSEAE